MKGDLRVVLLLESVKEPGIVVDENGGEEKLVVGVEVQFRLCNKIHEQTR